MSQNTHRRARIIHRAIARRQQHKRLDDLATDLMKQPRVVREMVYAKMSDRAAVRRLQALVKQKIADHWAA